MEKEIKRIWARPFNFVTDSDQKLFESFAGELSKETKYATTSILVADDSTPLAFLPVQLSFSFANPVFRPDTEPFQKILALNEMIRIVKYEGIKQGMGEAFLLSGNKDVELLAQKLGLEEIKGYRLKL